MDVNKILTADFLDILFEGRDKEYGAYNLRRTYNKRLQYALIGTVSICVLLSLREGSYGSGDGRGCVAVPDGSRGP